MKSECHADHRTNAGGGPRCVGEEQRREEGTEARMRRLSSPMNRHGWVCPNGAKGAANGKDLDY